MAVQKENTPHPSGMKRRIALIGNPNCGKSTLFNLLTGLHQSTANFPGATVEKKVGTFSVNSDAGPARIELVDLPGAYGMNPKSPDERIAIDYIRSNNAEERPDMVLYVADASNLKRSLFLATQIAGLKIPVVIALNMMDVIRKKGIELNVDLLSARLGITIVPVSAREGEGIGQLKKILTGPIPQLKPAIPPDGPEADEAQASIARYRQITFILQEVMKIRPKADEDVFSSRTDRIVTHKFWGFVIFLSVLFLIFEAVFVLASYPMEWIESLFLIFTDWGMNHLPPGELSDLLVNGVLSGLSGIVVFVPQIALLFFFIALLEDSGYMARVSFIMDRIMRRFGLNGRSVIPLLGGAACAVPAIMSARTISNRKERLITILVTPLISCSARLPVYTLLIALVIPSDTIGGFFNLQGLTLMFLYLIGFLAAIGAAWIMKYLLKSTGRSYFIMELPPYRPPRWKNVLITIVDRVKVFLFDAGKVIITISVILWFLASHGPGNSFEQIDKKYAGTEQSGDTAALIASAKLESSYAGILGKWIEPAIEPLGFDWKAGIALITSFAAREVFVGTMATIYSAGDEENALSIREKMAAEKDLITGLPRYSFAVGFSLMLFYAFSMQCMSTLAIVYRETNQLKWPVIQFIYMGVLAYLASFIAYQWLK